MGILGFLEGLEGHIRENIALLYENQASVLINETTTAGGVGSQASSSGSFETVVFPIVRRVFSKLLANDIVSVQALNLPIGKLFYFVPKIQGYSGGTLGSAAYAQNSGDHYAPVGSPGNYPGSPNAGYDSGTGTFNPTYAKNLYDLFYEGNEAALDPPGLFDYSKGRWSAVTATTTVMKWENGGLIDDENPDPGIRRKVIISLCNFATSGAGKLIGPDGSEMDTETFLSDLIILKGAGLGVDSGSTCTVESSTPLLYRVVTQQYGKVS